MAYAVLAGLDPVYGLISATVPLLVYALFTTSSQVAVGPVAPSAILMASTIQSVTGAVPRSPDFLRYHLVLAFMSGCFQLLCGTLRLGFIASLLSWPVMSGFSSGAAIIIIVSQAADLLKLTLQKADNTFVQLYRVFVALPTLHLPTLAIGVPCLLVLLFWKDVSLWGRKIPKRTPVPLLLVLILVVLSWAADLQRFGIRIVGDIPAALPAPSFPITHPEDIRTMLVPAVLIGSINYIQTVTLAVLFGKKAGERVSPGGEFFALGFASLVGSFFSCFTIAGSFTRSAVQADAGARTPLTTAFTGGLLIVFIYTVIRVFSYLPVAVLAAVVLSSTRPLISVADAVFLRRVKPSDFIQLMVTFLAVVSAGISDGLLVGIGFSLATVLYRSFKPRLTGLGRLPGTDVFVALERYPEAHPIPGVIVLRLDGELHFGNVAAVVGRLHAELEAAKAAAAAASAAGGGPAGASGSDAGSAIVVSTGGDDVILARPSRRRAANATAGGSSASVGASFDGASSGAQPVLFAAEHGGASAAALGRASLLAADAEADGNVELSAVHMGGPFAGLVGAKERMSPPEGLPHVEAAAAAAAGSHGRNVSGAGEVSNGAGTTAEAPQPAGFSTGNASGVRAAVGGSVTLRRSPPGGLAGPSSAAHVPALEGGPGPAAPDAGGSHGVDFMPRLRQLRSWLPGGGGSAGSLQAEGQTAGARPLSPAKQQQAPPRPPSAGGAASSTSPSAGPPGSSSTSSAASGGSNIDAATGRATRVVYALATFNEPGRELEVLLQGVHGSAGGAGGAGGTAGGAGGLSHGDGRPRLAPVPSAGRLHGADGPASDHSVSSHGSLAVLRPTAAGAGSAASVAHGAGSGASTGSGAGGSAERAPPLAAGSQAQLVPVSHILSTEPTTAGVAALTAAAHGSAPGMLSPLSTASFTRGPLARGLLRRGLSDASLPASAGGPAGVSQSSGGAAAAPYDPASPQHDAGGAPSSPNSPGGMPGPQRQLNDASPRQGAAAEAVPLRAVILDASRVVDIDATACRELQGVMEAYHQTRILPRPLLLVAGLPGPVRDTLDTFGLQRHTDPATTRFLNAAAAVASLFEREREEEQWEDITQDLATIAREWDGRTLSPPPLGPGAWEGEVAAAGGAASWASPPPGLATAAAGSAAAAASAARGFDAPPAPSPSADSRGSARRP
jgi:SulP family sulfate permease